MEIQIDNLESAEVKNLLQEHHNDMLKHSPVESVHALDLSSLKASDVTFWTVWVDGNIAACGALKQLTQCHAELKSMRTAEKYLRKGIAAKLLTHILAAAKKRNFERISLETGTMGAFIPAHNFYKSFGFKVCQPFADYQEDPYSLFLTLEIE